MHAGTHTQAWKFLQNDIFSGNGITMQFLENVTARALHSPLLQRIHLITPGPESQQISRAGGERPSQNHEPQSEGWLKGSCYLENTAGELRNSRREKRTPKQCGGCQLSLPSARGRQRDGLGSFRDLPHSCTKAGCWEERIGRCRLPLRCACLPWHVSHTRRLPFMMVSGKLASEPARKQLYDLSLERITEVFSIGKLSFLA